jgi:hypothetical protein
LPLNSETPVNKVATGWVSGIRILAGGILSVRSVKHVHNGSMAHTAWGEEGLSLIQTTHLHPRIREVCIHPPPPNTPLWRDAGVTLAWSVTPMMSLYREFNQIQEIPFPYVVPACFLLELK